MFVRMSSDMLQRITKIIVEQLAVKEEEVKPETRFREDLGADSLTVVELVMEIESQFGIEIPDEDANEIKTVQDLISYIEKKLSGS